jgi:predicted nuclease of predicted toxin-antitoxin system
MRVLLDMGLPRRSVGDLVALGFDAVHIGELGRSRESDEGILALATAEDRVVVTHDADFARLLALSRARHPSVIHFRIPRLSRELVSRVLPAVFKAVGADLAAGAMVSVSESMTRVRRLPLV